jgi:hypothetical protein
MGDKGIAAWGDSKRDFLANRRALHDAIGSRTQGIYGEVVDDWTCFNPEGKPRISVPFGPKRFIPSDHEPDGTEINNWLGNCYDRLADLNRLTRMLAPEDRANLDLRELSDSSLSILLRLHLLFSEDLSREPPP